MKILRNNEKVSNSKIWGKSWMYDIGILFILSFVILAFNWTECNVPGVLADEFGYWGNAAQLAGFDWSGVMSKTPYYGMGYSLFLYPLFRLNDFATRYHLAILINMFLLASSYFCAVSIENKIFEDRIDDSLKRMTALVSVYSVCSVSQAQIAWSETLISFEMWVCILLLASFEKQFSYLKCALIVMVNAFMILTHQRLLPIALLSVVCIVFLLLRNKKYLAVVCYVILFATLFLLFRDVKGYQVNHFYMNSETAHVNNVDSGLIVRYMNLIKNDFCALSMSLLGKMFAAIIGTYFVGIFCIIDFIGKVKNRRFDEKNVVTQIFVITSAVAMIGATALEMNGVLRQDLTVYTRYFDFTLGPITMFGLNSIISKKQKGSSTILWGTLVCVMSTSALITRYIDSGTYKFFNTVCSPIIGAFRLHSLSHESDSKFVQIYLMCMIEFLVFLMILAAIRTRSVTNKKLCLVILLTTNVLLANSVLDEVHLWRKNMSDPAFAICEETKGVENVFFLCEEENQGYMNNLRELLFIRPDVLLKEVSLNQAREISFESQILLSSKEIEVFNENLISKVGYVWVYGKSSD